MLRRIIVCGLLAASAAAAFSPAPAAAAGSLGAPLQCVLAPGVYGITDSTGRVVGLLIVYSDCRIEVYRRPLVE